MNPPDLLPILRYPDPRLHTVAKPVVAFDDRLRVLIERMLAPCTTPAASAGGHAVDVNERLVVIM